MDAGRACTPGVQSLWQFHEANDPERVDLEHDGCGAAIRVAPVGIVYSPGNLNGIRSIRNDLKQRPDVGADELAERYFPETQLTKVPLALALGTMMRSAGSAILLATNVGGDADSVASIAGGILGARHPDSVNELNVRKLKNLGLTESLETGYRLSPRGRRVLDALEAIN